jgi:hypothetical protein
VVKRYKKPTGVVATATSPRATGMYGFVELFGSKTSLLVKVLVLVLRCSKKAGHVYTRWTQLLLDVERLNSMVLPISLEEMIISSTLRSIARPVKVLVVLRCSIKGGFSDEIG